MDIKLELKTLESSTNSSICHHCQEPLPQNHAEVMRLNNHLFCCSGCKNVFQILSSVGLDEYYQIRLAGPTFTSSGAVHIQNGKFDYLDFPDFYQDFLQKISSDEKTMRFYLEGIHCLACLWLIERLPQLVPNVKNATLNLSTNCATITLSPNGKFQDVAIMLNKLGYRPHPIKSEEDQKRLYQLENRLWLYRIGTAGFATGNIMLFAAATYSGATGIYKNLFDLSSLILAIPVVFFSAIPFYKQALGSMRAKEISIDIPIALAVIFGFLASLFNYANGSSHLFFDSISALVFLLLSARYFLKRVQEKSRDLNSRSIFFASGTTERLCDGKWVEIPASMIQLRDQIKVNTQETIPADGILESESAFINMSLLTGESKPVKILKDGEIPCGAINIGAPLLLNVTEIGDQTRFGKILQKIKHGKKEKAQITSDIDQLARYFLYAVFALTAITLTYFLITSTPLSAFERALSLLIVTCPCAVVLASPLALSRSLSLAAAKGILIKDEIIFEKATKAKKIFFDKTGTLTLGKFEIKDFIFSEEQSDSLLDAVYSLESRSIHPVAKSISEYIEIKFPKAKNSLTINDYHELAGKGVRGTIDNSLIEISGSSEEENQTTVIIKKDGLLVLTITLSDQLRPSALLDLQSLREIGFTPYILSGDQKGPTLEVSNLLKLPLTHLYYSVSPETKYQIIKENPDAIMVGDGSNDSLALSNALVGIAVKGSVESSLLAADAYLTRPGISPLVILIQLSFETMRVIKRNLIFSIAYNLIGAYFAIIGFASPLGAAILMPVSSLTVLLSTLYGTKKMRKIRQGKY